MRKKLMKTVKLVFGIAALLALPSCLQNETTITLNKDGSGTVVEETFLGEQMMAMMAQFAQPGAPDPMAEMFSEDKAKGKVAKMGEGVEYVKTEMIDKDGRKGARIHYKFADINKLQVSPGDVVDDMNQEGEAPAEEKDKEDMVRFSYADGKLKVITPPTDFEEMKMDDGEEADNPQMEEMMKKMMADMSIKLNLKIADGIESTTASYVEGDTITLIDVQVGKMFAQKDKLKAIAETAKTDQAAAKEAFKKLDGVKMETEENVTVTIK
jgi:hypothetical protein